MSAPRDGRSVAPPTAVGRPRRARPLAAVVLAVVVTTLVVTLVGSAALPAGAGGATPPGPAEAAAAWLANQTSDGTITYLGAPDDGLAADAALSLTALGSADAAAATLTAQLAAESRRYTSPAGDGQVLSGPTAKLVLLAHARGLDPAMFGGRDLRAALQSTLVVDPGGRNDGRFADRPPTGATTPADASNGFSQAYGILALQRDGTGAPRSAVDYLLAQQCPNGGFRLFSFGARTCLADTTTDTDTTALAILALTSLPDPNRTALDRAVARLIAIQGDDGSFASPLTGISANTNTTGLAAAALRAAGRVAEADRATSWIERQQLGCADVPDGADAGAIAYSPTARQAALGAGVTPTARDQFRRATAQALLAFATVPLGRAPTSPVASAPPAACSTATTPGSTTVPTTPPTTSTPVATDPIPIPTDAAGDSPADVLGISQRSPATTSSPVVAELAFTGGHRAPIAVIGLIVLLAGLACIRLEGDHANEHPVRRRSRS